jgi:hypothetical protein
MKILIKITLLTLFISISLPILAQSSLVNKYNNRVKVVDDFRAGVDKRDLVNTSFLEKLVNYEHPQLIKSDEDSISAIKVKVIEVIEKSKYSSSRLTTYTAQNHIKELEVQLNERREFGLNLNKMNKIIDAEGHTKRMKRYIKAIQASKFDYAKGLKLLLPAREKEDATNLSKYKKYVVRNESNQTFIKKQIQKIKAKIEKSLKFSEDAVNILNTQTQIIAKQKTEFKKIKQILKTPQVDTEISLTLSGGFSCRKENKPRYYKMKDYPNLVILKNSDKFVSIIELDNSDLSKYKMYYRCSNFSTLGSCLKNRKKDSCRKFEKCKTTLDAMEASYDDDAFFPVTKSAHIDQRYNDRKISNANDLDILGLFEEQGRLVNLTRQDYKDLFKTFVTKAKAIEGQNSVEFLVSISTEIEKSRKVYLKKADNAGNQTDALEYFFNDLISFFKGVTKRENSEDFTYTKCGETQALTKDFCDKYKAWDKELQIFERLEELTNATPDECPRLVFREQAENLDQANKVKCEPSNPANIDLYNIDELNEQALDIIQMDPQT